MIEEPLTSLPSAPSPASPPKPAAMQTLDDARAVADRIRARARDHVMGRDDVIELALVALFAGGHVLLEDYPGSGKTTLAKALGASIVDDDAPENAIPPFRRIQFTPDLLPSDITGVMVFDTDSNTFHFRRGPIFAYVLLVDEINRTTPKVQAALLEAMAERQVTVDNVSHTLDELFFVIATQNPLDLVGTYPLPLAQLDRFLFKIRMKHVDRDSELEVMRRWGLPFQASELQHVLRADVVAARRLLRERVAFSERVRECLVDVARNLRDDARVLQGVSTRCLVQAVPALQTLAMLRGRDFVSSEDVELLAVPLFQHRMEMVPGLANPEGVIGDALAGPLERLSRSTLAAS